MTAGTGAEEQERLARQQAAQGRREHAIPEQRRPDRTASPERLVAPALEQLAAHGHLVLHDVHWPGRPQPTLDHVVVGPSGVLVAATSVSSGLTGTGTAVPGGGDTSSREPEALADAVAAVAAILQPQHRSLVSGVSIRGAQDSAPATVSGVTVLGSPSFVGWCLARPTVLTAAEVVAVHEHLRRSLTGPTSPPQLTTGHVLSHAGSIPEPSARARARRPVVRPATNPLPPRQTPAPNSDGAGPLRGSRTRRRTLLVVVATVLLFLCVPPAVVWVADAYGTQAVRTLVPDPYAPSPTDAGP